MIQELKNKVICADSIDIMKKFPDKSIDLCLCDPPYGIGIAKNGKIGGSVRTGFNGKIGNPVECQDYGKQEWDNKIPKKEYFDEIIRVSKNQIIFGGNYFVEYLKNSPCWIVWDKNNSGNFADCELAWTSFKTAVRKFKYTWNGMLQEDMKEKEARFHPTQKPVALFEWILSNYSNEGDLILDPFLGSGTTAVACQNLKRNFIGIEISEEYCKIARDRLRQQPLL